MPIETKHCCVHFLYLFTISFYTPINFFEPLRQSQFPFYSPCSFLLIFSAVTKPLTAAEEPNRLQAYRGPILHTPIILFGWVCTCLGKGNTGIKWGCIVGFGVYQGFSFSVSLNRDSLQDHNVHPLSCA